MWDDSAEDTSEVTWSKGDAELGGFVVIFFSFGEDVIIEELDEPFEGNEFNDGVGNLTTP